jgi:uncharacterized protein (TIGR03000 family)
MYSVVLLTALSAGSASPAWICNGCYGYGCCGGCYGCHGCCGGWVCSGCYGCAGCAGCWGGHGGHHFLGRLKGYWCHGGCHGCYGPQGCWGGFHASCACSGGWDGYGYGYPGGYVVPGAPAAPTTPAAPAGTAPKQMSPAGESGTPAKTGTTSLPQSARLIVQVPADARLYVDDQPMSTKSARRTFRTPELNPGQTYYYIVRAELVRDGKTYNQTRQILVRAGDEIQTSFPDLEKVILTTAQVDRRDAP